MIEEEIPESQKPQTFLRESDKGSSSNSSTVRGRFEKTTREVQDSVCLALEEADGGAKFKEDVWSRPGGGGGISSRVLQDGDVWEKAGVNVSDTPGAPRQWWFGGGTDLTPAYVFEEDVKHFHSVQKTACDKFDPSFYPRFKKWCDDYFYIKHRGERRGVGGIFFDDLNDYDQEMLLSFSTECANSVIPAYIAIIEKRKNTPFTDEHRAWQQLQRGRYVEFNLVYDRGTTFGLKTGGRIESILVSLPLTARWEYDHQPEEGTEEWKLLDACINPKEWV